MLGSRGLGLHTATAFLLAGASKVIISARKNAGAEGIDQAVEKLNKLNVSGKAIGIAANVADTEDIERLVKKVEEQAGKLDILVCNAGATWGGPFEPTPDWSSKKVLDLNVRGVFNLARLYVCRSLFEDVELTVLDSHHCFQKQELQKTPRVSSSSAPPLE